MSEKPKTPMIDKQLSKIMKDISPMAMGQKNKQQGWAFRGIYDFYNALHPLMAKHDVICRPVAVEVLPCIQPDKGYKVAFIYTYSFSTTDGSSKEVVAIGESKDFSDKACNAAASAAQKYAFQQTFCIPTDDLKDADETTKEDDYSGGNVSSGEYTGKISEKQVKFLWAMASKAGWRGDDLKQKVKQHFDKSLSDLTKPEMEQVLDRLKKETVQNEATH